MTSSGNIMAEDMEFLTLALRRAQAYYSAMAGNEAKPEFDSIAWELCVLQSLDTDAPLLEWQLSDVSAV